MGQSEHVERRPPRTYTVLLFVVHKRGNGATGVGTITCLTMNVNGGTTDAEMVDGAGDGTRRGRHCIAVMREEITKEVDGEQPANGVPYIPSRLGQ